MAVTRIGQSTIKQGLKKNETFTAGIPPILGKFYHMGTVEVGAGGASSIEFTNIPAIYKHLQLRLLLKDARTTDANYYNGTIKFNNSSTGYARHFLDGSGSTPVAYGAGSLSIGYAAVVMNSHTSQANCFSANVVDILDYSNTSKTKVVKSVMGTDFNTAGDIRLQSCLWNNTSAISSMLISSDSGNNFVQYSSVSLYGVK